MVIELKIPSPGESITEVEIASWLVKDGDYVRKDQEIAEIESDKATLPLIAEKDGEIKILVEEGESIAVGAIACTIDTSIAAPADVTAASSTTPASEPQNDIQEPEKETVPVEQKKSNLISSDKNSHIKATPLAKKLMNEHQVNVDDIINGLKRLTRADVEMVINNPSTPDTKKTVIPDLSTSKEKSRDVKHERMSSLRRKVSQRLVAVKNETAMLTTFNEVDMSAILEMRKKYQKSFVEKYGIKLGFMSFFTMASAVALKSFPKINSQIENDEIITPEYVDIAIAVQTNKGLMVPVIRNVETMNLAETEIAIAEIAKKARAFKITPEEMTGGTFTITNGGVFGSLLSTPILNPPQSGILGMHNVVERPVALNGQVVIRPMMYIALSYDHRIVDGRDSVSFLVRLKELLENPYKLLFGDTNPEQVLLGF